jgi:RNA polymerase sigma-70 factor (ECF subfamily)
MPPSSDEALYQRLLDGDLSAFDRLYQRYERPLFGFIRRHLPAQGDAEEVFHEAFLALLREKDAQRNIRSFRAWIYQVARNICLNRIRGRRRAERATARLDRPPPPEEPEGAASRQQIAAALRAAVERLPEPLGELYALRAGGLSYEEVAQVLEIPLGTVKSRMHQMVVCLRQEMKA